MSEEEFSARPLARPFIVWGGEGSTGRRRPPDHRALRMDARDPPLAMKTTETDGKISFLLLFLAETGSGFGKYGYGNGIRLRESTETNQYER